MSWRLLENHCLTETLSSISNLLTFPTDGAAVWPVVTVQSLMGPQGVRVPQGFPTVAAEEHLPRVGEQVSAELRLLGESLLAVGARVRFLPAVNSKVAL